jgi:hypothetical protein
MLQMVKDKEGNEDLSMSELTKLLIHTLQHMDPEEFLEETSFHSYCANYPRNKRLALPTTTALKLIVKKPLEFSYVSSDDEDPNPKGKIVQRKAAPKRKRKGPTLTTEDNPTLG